MQVFRMYFKVLKKELPAILVYVFVFVLILYLAVIGGSSEPASVFEKEKAKIAWFSDDPENDFLKLFRKYLEDSCEFITIEGGTVYEETEGRSRFTEKLDDALFFKKITTAILVPKGFTEAFFAGESPQLIERGAEGDPESILVEHAVNQFLNTAALYREYSPDNSLEHIGEMTASDLNVKAGVELSANYEKTDNRLISYANYLSYGLLVILIMGVGVLMVIFQQADIKRRNMVSPLSTGRFNFQLFLADLVFALFLLLCLLGLMFWVCPGLTLDFRTLLIMGNAFVFTICALAISFLVGICIKNKNLKNATANCISLALCFLGGVFVPLEMLDGNVLRLSGFLPTFWYVKANTLIGSLKDMSDSSMEDIASCFVIELGFALVLFLVAMVIAKRKNSEK